MTEPVDRTPLTRRNRIQCRECGSVIESGDMKRTVRWGSWSSEQQLYEERLGEDHYCEDCWRNNFGKESVTEYDVRDVEAFWNMLNASDGRLVAKIWEPMYPKIWIRVANDSLKAITASHKNRSVADSIIVKTVIEELNVDREWFMTILAPDMDADTEDEQYLTLKLEQVEETPFSNFRTTPDSQVTLNEM